MTRSSPETEKSELRRRLRQARKAMPEAARMAAAVTVAGYVAGLPEIPPASTIAGYWPMGSELDPRPAMGRLLAAGHRLALPVVTGQGEPLSFRSWAPGDPLTEGAFGLEPVADAPAARPTVILVPLVGFDRDLWRLGQGGGFYDRTLALLPDALSIGVAFACQEADRVPRGEFDLPLRRIVTQIRVFS